MNSKEEVFEILDDYYKKIPDKTLVEMENLINNINELEKNSDKKEINKKIEFNINSKKEYLIYFIGFILLLLVLFLFRLFNIYGFEIIIFSLIVIFSKNNIANNVFFEIFIIIFSRIFYIANYNLIIYNLISFFILFLSLLFLFYVPKVDNFRERILLKFFSILLFVGGVLILSYF